MEIDKAIRESDDRRLKTKYNNAIYVIKRALALYSIEEVAFSFNGGKDSTVLLHLLRAGYFLHKMEQKCSNGGLTSFPIRTIYFESSAAFPEINSFTYDTASSYGLQLDIISSDFKSGLEKLLKANPIRAIFLGVRIGDPTAVGQEQFSPSSPGWPPFMRVNPILDWSYRDVWAFILTCKVQYCSLYDQGYTSIGSIHDTVPNALLSVSDSCCKEKFKPAYLLSDGRLERAGRAKKFSSSSNADGNGSGSVDSHKSSLLVASVIAVGEEILSGSALLRINWDLHCVERSIPLAESQFNYNLNFYSKSKDLHSAISLYDTAISQDTRLNQHSFNTLLYLCSVSLIDPSKKELALQCGFRIFDHMVSNGIKPNEASITAVARLAAAKGDGDYAFDLVKNVGAYNELPRLRTYDPALFCFCEKLEADKAYEVEEHMGSMGVGLEEGEIAALLKVSVESRNEKRVYGYLQKLRKMVRCVGGETAKVIENWFAVFEGSGVELDVDLMREAVSSNGGGWHGLGWIGKGKWVLKRGSVDVGGKCCCCGEQLVSVDIDDDETERFAESVAGLAMEREVKANFSEFQNWLEEHANYEAIVDGANIGLYQQNFAEGGFSISQLDAVVKDLYNQSGKKWPLIIMHNKRIRALLQNPSTRELIQEWIEKDVLYTTPQGSNDDWYWLYAAVKLRCLLVTNDEMRDHIFELLGSDFFIKWKERHQVRYTFVKGKLELQMPPLFSVVIQESENGSWHVPVAGNGNDSRQSWLCVSRPRACDAPEEDSCMEGSKDSNDICCNSKLLSFGRPESLTSCKNKLQSQASFQESDNKITALTCKRKERSPSPSYLHVPRDQRHQ